MIPEVEKGQEAAGGTLHSPVAALGRYQIMTTWTSRSYDCLLSCFRRGGSLGGSWRYWARILR